MKILVRLPNWLGDLVMSLPLIEHIGSEFPGAELHVIIKKGLEPLLNYFPPIQKTHVFSKEAYPGLMGAYQFGRQLKKEADFNLFICLPDSFSSACMGWASGAKKRIGYSKELRSFLLTHSFKKDINKHFVFRYVNILEQYLQKELPVSQMYFHNLPPATKEKMVLLNFNSEAIARRLPKEKAVQVITQIKQKFQGPLVLIGGPKDRVYTEEVLAALPQKEGIINKTGEIPLQELPVFMSKALAIVTTDSGPAHVANAAGLNTIVITGAGNEKVTGPFNLSNGIAVRYGALPCEPCIKNTCIYGLPKCLQLLEDEKITKALADYLKL